MATAWGFSGWWRSRRQPYAENGPRPTAARCVVASLAARQCYGTLRAQSRHWPQAERELAAQLPQGAPLLEDLFYLLYEPGAPLDPGVDPAFHWNFAVVAAVSSCPYYRRLQKATAGDPVAAALAALQLAQSIAAQQVLAEAWKKRWWARWRRNGRGPAFGIPLRGGTPEGSDVYYPVAAAVRQAAASVQADSALRAAWGILPGAQSLHHFDSVWELLALAREIPWIEELTEAMEHLRRLLPAPRRHRRPGNVGRTRVAGYTLGRDLEQLAPEEVVKLADRHLEGLFYEAYDHRRLLQQAYTGHRRQGRGPLVCCMDVSRSMNAPAAAGRERFLWAKAVGLSLLDWARRGKRPFLGICFSSEHELASFPMDGVSYDPGMALRMAQCDFNGGTRFEGPINAALDFFEETSGREGHVVFITDGEAPLPEAVKQRVRRVKAQLGIAFFSVFIDGHHEGLGELSDRIFHVRAAQAGSWEGAVASIGRCLASAPGS